MIRFHKLTILISSLSLSCVALAGETSNTLPITTTVTATCYVYPNNPIDFGSVEENQTFTYEGEIFVNCTAGTNYNIALDAGLNFNSPLRYMKSSLNELIAYRITTQAGTEWGDAGFGNTYPNGATVSGTGGSVGHFFRAIVGATPEPGESYNENSTYSDTMTITVHF